MNWKNSLILLCAVSTLHAQSVTQLDPALGLTTLPLYADDLPPTGDQTPGTAPTLTVFAPQPGRGNGSAVIVAPGGAYLGLAANLEGRQIADWFTGRGFTAFVLRYRLGEKNIYPVPLEDARRAMRLVRSLAASYKLAPDRIGIVGFSAGGHLAASVATLSDSNPTTSSDPVDNLSARPDFVVLGYPWLNAMEPQVGKEITYCSLIHTVTPAQCNDFATRYTPKLHVTAHTPTTFIYATTDDVTVPIRASTEFYEAMVKAGAPVEMHLFRHGDHGSGLGLGQPSLDLWPVLLEQWLRDIQVLDTRPPKA
jgi:acetyl esterase/lipase